MNKFKNHYNYNCKVTLDDNSEILVFANWLHNEGLDNWQGWVCNSGAEQFCIDNYFDIWAGVCQNELLGNVLTEWNPVDNTICKRKTCTGCGDDLMAKKYPCPE